MGRSQESFSKKEKEKKRRKKKQEKRERREQRKAEKEERGAVSFEDMLSYVDENGNLTSTPPDPSKRKKIKAEDIVLGAAVRLDDDMDSVRKGKVKFFNVDKGYGFIIDNETKESIFVHIKNISVDLNEGDRVSFEVEMGQKGPNAINVQLV
ncbi:MAG: cold shock domain-containing protein [Bacteroidota bacterium]